MRITNPSSRYFWTILIALWMAVPVLAETVHPAALSQIRIKNFGKIDDRYYRGSQPKNNDYSDLAALGVKTVINLIGDEPDAREQQFVEDAGMKYQYIPMLTRRTPTDAEISRFLNIVNDPEAQPVYVHCVGGKHRTGVMTAVYRMTQGWTADQAFKEMKEYKFGADFFHPEFKKFVFKYQQPTPSSGVPVPQALPSRLEPTAATQ